MANNVSIVNTRNRMLSQNLYMTLDTRHTDLNNNILVIGGSGAGKTFRFVKPNIMQMSSTFIVTDPKGEIAKSCAMFLKAYGYNVKILNLLSDDGMKKSIHYNPFRYIRNEIEIPKLVTNIIKNTTPKGATQGDPFWEKAESMYLQSLFYYVWLEAPKKEKNFRKVVELMKKAECNEDPMTGKKIPSELDIIFRELEEREPEHLAVTAYNQVMRGAVDTIRSIVISANARFANLQTDEILTLLDDDEVNIPDIGKEKTALFCVIPDTDKTYNFIIGMLYSQIFQELYYQADFVYDGRLPVHVTFMMDEFANVALPEDFCSLLSTMRSREISSVIIIQNLAQIKALFKDTWETITGNCDTLIYLGGNEQSTHEYISKLLGKATIDKQSSGETRGRQGSSSKNYDVIGRELMLPEEVRKVDGKKCLIFIRGFDPVFDEKINSLKHPFWDELVRGEKNYFYDARLERKKRENNSGLKILSEKEMQLLLHQEKKIFAEYENECNIARITGIAEPDKPRKLVYEISYKDLITLNMDYVDKEVDTEQLFSEEFLEKNRKMAEENLEQLKTKKEIDIEELSSAEEATLYLRLRRENYNSAQTKILLALFRDAKKYSDDEILKLFSPEMEPDEMQLIAEKLKIF